MWWELLKFTLLAVSGIQYNSVKYIHCAVYHILRTYSYNWKFVPFDHVYPFPQASRVAQMVKNPTNAKDPDSIPELGRSLWRREWQPTAVFLHGEFHGQRSLVGYTPWGHKELDMAKHACKRVHIHTHASTDTHMFPHPFTLNFQNYFYSVVTYTKINNVSF